MKNRENIIFAVFFILVPLFLFRDGLAYGKIFNAFDTITLDIPFRMFAQEMFFKYHQLPFWLPGILTGIPLIDSTNLMYFYPPAIFTMVLGIPAWATCTAFVILHMIFSAAGMYLFLKSSGLNKPGALFGAMAFMTSGIVVSYVAAGHLGNIIAATFIPYVFYFFRQGFGKKKFIWYAGGALCLAMQILCIGMQIMAYTFLAASIYLAYLRAAEYGLRKGAAGTIGILAATAGAALLFSAPQFIASLKYFGHSWRTANTYDYFTSWSFHPEESLIFILPQLFGVTGGTFWGFTHHMLNTYYFGTLPFLFFPLAFIKGGERRTPLFFSGLGLFFLLLSFGKFTPFYSLVYHVPVLNSFRVPGRFLYLFTFCVITAGATGVSNLFAAQDNSGKNALKTVYFSAVAVCLSAVLIVVLQLTGMLKKIIGAVFFGINNYHVTNKGFDIISRMIWHDTCVLAAVTACFLIIAVLVLKGRLKSAVIAVILLCAVQFADTARIEKYFISYMPYTSIISANDPIAGFFKGDRSIYRVMDPEDKCMPNLNLYFGTEFLKGYHGFVQSKFLKMKDDGALSDPRILRMLNVKYYIWPDGRAPAYMTKVLDGNPGVYLDRGYMERFYVAGSVINLADEGAVYSYIRSPGFNPRQAVVYGHPELAAEAGKGAGKVEVEEYTPSRIKLKVISDRPGMLVFSNYFYESWKAKSGQQDTKVYNVNYLVSGVMVHKGENMIALYFDGGYIIAGIWIMLLLFAVYGIYVFLAARAGAKEFGPDKGL
jgi:hypothetical protein